MVHVTDCGRYKIPPPLPRGGVREAGPYPLWECSALLSDRHCNSPDTIEIAELYLLGVLVSSPLLPLERSLTRVCSEVASECITPAASVVAEGTFEGLLPRVQLDVAQQVPLLSEGGTTLVAVEGPFTCK